MVGHYDGLFSLPAAQRKFSNCFSRTTVAHTHASITPTLLAHTLHLFFCSDAICVVLFFTINNYFSQLFRSVLCLTSATLANDMLSSSFSFVVALDYILASNQLFSYYSNFHLFFSPTCTPSFQSNPASTGSTNDRSAGLLNKTDLALIRHALVL